MHCSWARVLLRINDYSKSIVCKVDRSRTRLTKTSKFGTRPSVKLRLLGRAPLNCLMVIEMFALSKKKKVCCCSFLLSPGENCDFHAGGEFGDFFEFHKTEVVRLTSCNWTVVRSVFGDGHGSRNGVLRIKIADFCFPENLTPCQKKRPPTAVSRAALKALARNRSGRFYIKLYRSSLFRLIR